jgi:hypothetical protein
LAVRRRARRRCAERVAMAAFSRVARSRASMRACLRRGVQFHQRACRLPLRGRPRRNEANHAENDECRKSYRVREERGPYGIALLCIQFGLRLRAASASMSLLDQSPAFCGTCAPGLRVSCHCLEDSSCAPHVLSVTRRSVTCELCAAFRTCAMRSSQGQPAPHRWRVGQDNRRQGDIQIPVRTRCVQSLCLRPER